MKKYDLMHQVNGRGTFLCTQKCLPYLRRGRNPHVLNISPPLSMQPKWFKDHCAYTAYAAVHCVVCGGFWKTVVGCVQTCRAKYLMSMYALGMADELRGDSECLKDCVALSCCCV